MSLWWLSFAKPGLPAVAICEAADFLDAVERARHEGVNPGGEVRGIELDPTKMPAEQYALCQANTNRLMLRDELRRLGLIA